VGLAASPLAPRFRRSRLRQQHQPAFTNLPGSRRRAQTGACRENGVPLQFLEIDISIDRSGDAYRARVQSPLGEVDDAVRLPFEPIELENYLLKLSPGPVGVRRAPIDQAEIAKTVGRRLFESLLTGRVRAALEAARAAAEQSDSGLRVRLRLAGVPEISAYPWEYLFDADSDDFLALSPRTSIVRYLQIPKRVRPLRVRGPIRILLVSASPPEFDELDVDEEEKRLREGLKELIGLGSAEVVRLDHATLTSLHDALSHKQFHVFHFAGHGTYDDQAGRGVLLFEGERGGHRLVTGDQLGITLQQSDIRLAILNSCLGAYGCQKNVFGGVAQGLVQKGIPAVIAMQFPIRDQAAIRFSRYFYSALARSNPVDLAVTEGRRAMYATGGADWGSPVLVTVQGGEACSKSGAGRPA
jgi:hypothetical protein